MTINGIVLINKERGISSNKVVNTVKRILKADKAGHLGTLDVLGEGLLPVTLGRGTKLFDYFLNKDKVYITTFKFGETTATLDLEGEVTQKNNVVVSLEDLETALNEFIGKQLQMPPAYSAKKIGGHKAYELARSGEEVLLKPKEIEIYSIRILEEVGQNIFKLEVHCSSGTYIRSLCRDIAERFSTYGVMVDIRRTKCGDFDIQNSYTLTDLEQGVFNLITLDSLFDYSILNLSDDEATKILNGVFLPSMAKDGIYKVFHENVFLGIGQVKQATLKLELRLV